MGGDTQLPKQAFGLDGEIREPASEGQLFSFQQMLERELNQQLRANFEKSAAKIQHLGQTTPQTRTRDDAYDQHRVSNSSGKQKYVPLLERSAGRRVPRCWCQPSA